MSNKRARQLRQRSTWAEKRLWRLVRSRRLAGYKFRRQHREGPYFLDLYCLEARLAVEVDGFGHGHPDHHELDRARDAFLAERGILVKHIWNHQLARWEDRENLLQNLWQLLQERAPHPENVAPPPFRRQPGGTSPGEPSP